MKRILFLLFATATLLTGCMPQTFYRNLQVRRPSPSGLDLARKTMSVVYLSDPDTTVENVAQRQALRLAAQLESDYYERRESVGVFRLDKDPAGDYHQFDTLVRLIVGTGDDVVFLVDTPEGDGGNYSIYTLDSMSGSDKIYHSAGVGSTFSAFVPDWKEVTFEVLYFDSASKWVKASNLAYDDKWADAARIWMELAESGKPLQRAAACYNVGLASFLLGDSDLAVKWLDRSDAYCKLEPTPRLRKIIASLQ